MKVLGLAIGMLFAITGASFADTVSYDVYGGLNQVSAPLVPLNPDAQSVFAGAASGIDTLLQRWDPSTGIVIWDGLEEPAGASFGGVLLGDGYLLPQDGKSTVSYEGVPDGVPDAAGVKTDMWISLPGNQGDGADKGGYHLIGQPFNHNTPVDDGTGTGANIFITDGTTVLKWADAVAQGWVADQFDGWNAASGAFSVRYDGLGDTDKLEKGKGYWFLTGKDNLALIIPAAPEVQ